MADFKRVVIFRALGSDHDHLLLERSSASAPLRSAQLRGGAMPRARGEASFHKGETASHHHSSISRSHHSLFVPLPHERGTLLAYSVVDPTSR